MKGSAKPVRKLPVIPLVAACLLLAGSSGCGPAIPPAQTNPSSSQPAKAVAAPGEGVTRGFKHPEYDAEQRLRSMLTGVEARPAGEGIMRISGLKLETYDKDGKVEMIIEAPECYFNRKDRSARSEGTLHMRSADGTLDYGGRGFEWTHSTGDLVVTNDSRTEIQVDRIKKENLKP